MKQNIQTRPFGITYIDDIPNDERGYDSIPNDWSYNPETQTSNLLYMGESSPTTRSQVGGTTGFIGTDSDEANDDKGSD